MKKAFVSALLIATAWVSPVNATPTIEPLLAAITRTGTKLAVDTTDCKKNKQLRGQYHLKPGVKDELLMCLENHDDSMSILETLLHETVHMVQACNGRRPLYTAESILALADAEEIRFVAKNYTDDDFYTEMEARVISKNEDEDSMITIINKFCK